MFGGICHHPDFDSVNGDADVGYQLFDFVEYHAGCCSVDDISVYPKTA